MTAWLPRSGARRGDGAATESEALLADLHVAFGIAVFVLALLRVALRVTRGAPPPPEAEHPALRTVARATHLALYAIILAMPVTGGLAWFAGMDTMAELHGAGKVAVFVLVILHVAGALYHHFVLKTDVLRRMLRGPRGRRRSPYEVSEMPRGWALRTRSGHNWLPSPISRFS